MGSNNANEFESIVGQILGTAKTPEDADAILRQLLGAGSLGFGVPGLDPEPIELAEPPAIAQLFTVRVDLHGAKPPIWRKLTIPGQTVLEDLHGILQIAMGWTNSHMHHFELHRRGGRPGPFFTTDMDDDDGGTHEALARLDQVLTKPGDKLRYEYDFGDGWEHILTVQEVEPAAQSTKQPRVGCIGGRRACPPEDCGGLGGYADIIEALQTPAGQLSEWGSELLEFVPEDFDPARFDVAETDWMLREYHGGGGPPRSSG